MGCGFAVDADSAVATGFGTCFKLVCLVQTVERGFDLPAQRFGAAGQIVDGGAAKATTWRQKRDGFKQVGFARTVGTKDRDRARIDGDDRALVRAEVRQGQIGKG